MDNESARYRLIDRLVGPDGTMLTHAQIARIHAIIDEGDQGWFPDNANQTDQAKWIKRVAGGAPQPQTNNTSSHE